MMFELVPHLISFCKRNRRNSNFYWQVHKKVEQVELLAYYFTKRTHKTEHSRHPAGLQIRGNY